MLLATFGVGQVLLSMFWFFLFFIWIMLLFRVIADIFRSHDISGAMKVIWLLFVIVTPYLGVFVYLIARGGHMANNEMAAMQSQDAAAREYIRAAAGSTGTADELARLAELHKAGTLSDAEFAAAKAKIVG